MVISLRLNEPEPERPLTDEERRDREYIEGIWKRFGGKGRVVLTPEERAEYRRYLSCRTGEPRD